MKGFCKFPLKCSIGGGICCLYCIVKCKSVCTKEKNSCTFFIGAANDEYS